MNDTILKNFKFNCCEDQALVVDNNTDVISFIRNITKTGLQEDAFYVLDAQDVIEKYKNWKEKLPRITPYYAVKCNDNLFLLKILSLLGVGFDCASKEEIRKLLDFGVGSSRIIYANPVKLPSHLKYAADQNIELMTFDNESELYKLKTHFSSAKLLLRFKCDSRSCWVLGKKFGCDPITEAPALLRLARALKLEVVGICFHVGSGCEEPESFRRAIITARDLFEFGKSIGFDMEILDIGGGFHGAKGTSINAMADIINEALEEYFPINSNFRIIAEPGTYFCASAITVATLVFSKRTIVDAVTDLSRNMYFVNDGVYGSFNSVYHYNLPIDPVPLSDLKSQNIVPCSIWGQTCDSVDCIIDDVKLPDMNVGEWIIFENMGAYSSSTGCSFNGFRIPRVICMLTESTWLQLNEAKQLFEGESNFKNSAHLQSYNLKVAQESEIGKNTNILEFL